MQSLDEISYNLQNYLNADEVYGISAWIVVAILLLVVWIGFVSRHFHTQGVGQLFLRMKFHFMERPATTPPLFRKSDAKASNGFLRSLGEKHAVFVSPVNIPKASIVRLDMQSLPNFPAREVQLDGEVIACREIPGDHPHYLVTIKFAVVPEEAHKPLKAYLKHLVA